MNRGPMAARLTSESELDTREMTASAGTTIASARVLGVLGMHRSGTSLVTGLIANAGVSVGTETSLFAADRHNATGYYEQREVVALNDEILAHAGASWWSPPETLISARPEWVARARDIAETAEITGHDKRLAVLKDPRMSLTWPVWTQALRRNAYPVVVVRHPVDVARSLWLRDGMPLPVGLALWEHYVCTMFKALGEQEAQVVHYDALINQPGEALRWLAQLLDATGSDDPFGRAEAACDRLLRVNDAARTLRERSADDVLTRHQADLWAALSALRNGTTVHPDTLESQFQLSPASRDTLSVYRERTQLTASQAETIADLTSRHAQDTRRMEEAHQAAVSEMSEKLAAAELARADADAVVADLRTALAGLEARNEGLERALAQAEADAARHHANAEALQAILSSEREDQRRKDAKAAELSSQVAEFKDKASRLQVSCEQLRGSAATVAASHREAMAKLERALGELTFMRAAYMPVEEHDELVATLRAQIHQLGTQQHLMHQSWTWRAGRTLLAPFRVLGSLFRRRATAETPAHV